MLSLNTTDWVVCMILNGPKIKTTAFILLHQNNVYVTLHVEQNITTHGYSKVVQTEQQRQDGGLYQRE